MKKFLLVVAVTVLSLLTVFKCEACIKHVTLPLTQIHTDAAFKQFKRASAPNQREVIGEFIRMAEEKYYVCQTIDEFEVLRVQVEFINRYIDKYRWSFLGLRKNYMLSERMRVDLLHKKIVAKVCEMRGGVMIFTEAGEYHDFGQELD